MPEQTPNPNDPNDQQPKPDAKPVTPPKQEEPQKVTFTDEQQKEIDRLIGAARRDGRKAAEDDAAEVKRKTDEAAEQQRKIEAGKFDEVRQTLESERDQALAKAAHLDALIEALRPEIDEQWKGLPAEVTELYEGADDDVLAKRAHIARTRKLIDKLTGTTDQKRQAASFGRTPTPNGTRSNLEEGMEQGRRTGKYSA